MALRIVSIIESVGPDRRARRLHFQDGGEPRVTSAAAVKTLGVAEGASIDLDELACAEADLARDRALRYLGYRDRTCHEIVTRLVADGYPPALARSIEARLSELAFLDDDRLARTWAQNRAMAGYGPRRITRELLQRGIHPDTASDAVLLLGESSISRARAAITGRPCATPRERDRLIRRLVSRGFDLSVALQAVREEGHTSLGDEPFIAP